LHGENEWDWQSQFPSRSGWGGKNEPDEPSRFYRRSEKPGKRLSPPRGEPYGRTGQQGKSEFCAGSELSDWSLSYGTSSGGRKPGQAQPEVSEDVPSFPPPVYTWRPFPRWLPTNREDDDS
jgi:hypothetical protein